jgi:hypothetical protein
MKINQNDWMLLICIILDLVILIDKYAMTRAVHRADVAEQALAACLNKRPITGDDKDAVTGGSSSGNLKLKLHKEN